MEEDKREVFYDEDGIEITLEELKFDRKKVNPAPKGKPRKRPPEQLKQYKQTYRDKIKNSSDIAQAAYKAAELERSRRHRELDKANNLSRAKRKNMSKG